MNRIGKYTDCKVSIDAPCNNPPSTLVNDRNSQINLWAAKAIGRLYATSIDDSIDRWLTKRWVAGQIFSTRMNIDR